MCVWPRAMDYEPHWDPPIDKTSDNVAQKCRAGSVLRMTVMVQTSQALHLLTKIKIQPICQYKNNQ